MVNPYIVPGARVRYRWLPTQDFAVTEVSERCNAVQLGGGVFRWYPMEDFKPVVRVKMGRHQV
jgi:hypothetical protein